MKPARSRKERPRSWLALGFAVALLSSLLTVLALNQVLPPSPQFPGDTATTIKDTLCGFAVLAPIVPICAWRVGRPAALLGIPVYALLLTLTFYLSRTSGGVVVLLSLVACGVIAGLRQVRG